MVPANVYYITASRIQKIKNNDKKVFDCHRMHGIKNTQTFLGAWFVGWLVRWLVGPLVGWSAGWSPYYFECIFLSRLWMD
jgi:hypothetical protein